MADFGDDHDFSIKPKSLLFNRSQTMQSTPIKKPNPTTSFIDRTTSVKKIYGSPFDTMVTASTSIKGKVQKLRNFFESKKSKKHVNDELPSPTKPNIPNLDYKAPIFIKSVPIIRLPGTEDRIVVYFTSLHSIRRTYEDCYAVRMLLGRFRVCVDERDVSMDSAFRKELESVLGEKNVSLPQVFIRGKYVGGVDAIKQIHEIGELAKMLEGFPLIKPGYKCEECGGARFVPCTTCDGSRKVFDEDEDVLKRCLECNENGLIRCSSCCY